MPNLPNKLRFRDTIQVLQLSSLNETQSLLSLSSLRICKTHLVILVKSHENWRDFWCGGSCCSVSIVEEWNISLKSFSLALKISHTPAAHRVVLKLIMEVLHLCCHCCFRSPFILCFSFSLLRTRAATQERHDEMRSKVEATREVSVFVLFRLFHQERFIFFEIPSHSTTRLCDKTTRT